MTEHWILETPIGLLKATISAKQLYRLTFLDEINDTSHPNESEPSIIGTLKKELNSYFQGELKNFSIPIAPEGTPFQLQVWNTLCEIPYGTTISYKAQSERMKNPKAIRAMAAANGKNPIVILIPCHRIIGSKGELTGYSGGIERKRKLLQLERKYSGQKDLFNL